MKKRFVSILLALALGGGALLPACAPGDRGTLIGSYSGGEYDVNGDLRINEELFFRNGLKGVSADPFVFDNTSRDGYYYIVSTDGPAYMYRSRNMMDLEPVGPAVVASNEAEKAVVDVTPFWAPEIVYDGEANGGKGLYYLFFSTYGQAGDYAGEAGLLPSSTTSPHQVLFVATSETARGPYRLVNMNDLDHQEYRNVCTEPGTPLSTKEDMPYGVDENGVAQAVTEENEDLLYRFAYPTDKLPYAAYGYFPQEDYIKYLSKYQSVEYNEVLPGLRAGNAGYTTTIDAHPFVDEEGNKWLYWTENDDNNNIYCCPMYHNDWLYPNLSEARPVVCSWYYTAEDYLNAQEVARMEDELHAICPDYEYDEGEDAFVCAAGHAEHPARALPEGVSYQTDRTDARGEYGSDDSHVNEGPEVIYHNGKYYMTFSIGNYRDNTYRVMQAVSDKPNEGWRKLRPEEGGVILSGQDTGSEEVTGTGHNSIITIGDQLFIYYHTHDDPSIMDTQRHGNIDELRWITIKDKDGNDLDVLYANGPQGVPQPRIEAYAAYKNIAEEASVSVTEGALAEGSSERCLNDGLLSVLRSGLSEGTREFADTYIKETQITQTTTFSFDFEEGRSVRAVLVYTSKNASDIFFNIPKIEFVGTDADGKEAVYYLKDVKLDQSFYRFLEGRDIVTYVNVGAFAFAEFYELERITSVRITVEKPEGQAVAGISEIRILGK